MYTYTHSSVCITISWGYLQWGRLSKLYPLFFVPSSLLYSPSKIRGESCFHSSSEKLTSNFHLSASIDSECRAVSAPLIFLLLTTEWWKRIIEHLRNSKNNSKLFLNKPNQLWIVIWRGHKKLLYIVFLQKKKLEIGWQ